MRDSISVAFPMGFASSAVETMAVAELVGSRVIAFDAAIGAVHIHSLHI